jgi:hypothetical protein
VQREVGGEEYAKVRAAVRGDGGALPARVDGGGVDEVPQQRVHLDAQAALKSSVAALAGALEAQLPLLSDPGVLAVAAAATDSWRAAAALMGGAATGGLLRASPVALQASTMMSSVLSLVGLFGASFGNQTAVLATVEQANGALYDYFNVLADVDGSLFYDLSTNAATIGTLASTLADQPAISAQLKRLRALTGDALLVRSGTGLAPTATALSLVEPAARPVSGMDSMG